MMHSTLVSTDELLQHKDDPNWVVIDCRFTLTETEAGRSAYQHSHIPHARYAHMDEDLSGPKNGKNGRHPLPSPEVLAAKLGGWGVDNQTQVVVYDDSFGAMAVRLWWLLRWLGHDAVALLDGGLPKWQREGHPMTSAMPDITAKTFTPNLREEMRVDANDVLHAVQRADRLLVDARAEMRFSGEKEPLDPVAGHVPGAVNLPFDDNLDMAGTLLSAAELRELYTELLGDKSPDNVIHMCGSGVTACHNLLAMEIAGMTGSKLYAGSWSEWISEPTRPVVKGY